MGDDEARTRRRGRPARLRVEREYGYDARRVRAVLAFLLGYRPPGAAPAPDGDAAQLASGRVTRIGGKVV